MPPRKKFSGALICKILEQNGFVSVRQKGSHRVLQRQALGKTITVPVPMHKDLKPGTLASIIRQSQLDRLLFER
jgi:predicted RNA binding protein YcfA (HicA-like mRNA interferase family)|tara:strand:- start:44 stop:265 length:222 start_codon:yes stop_codon:yes gene_type:complete